MKLLNEIPVERYNDADFVLEHLKNNKIIGSEIVEPIGYFHCFWKGVITDLHYMCLKSLYETNPNISIILWTPNALEIQGTLSWLKIKKLFNDKINIVEVKREHFVNAKAERFFPSYSMLVADDPDNGRYNHNVAYASDIIRFVVLYLYGGVWFDMDIYFLRDLNDIKINRYVSQWGDGKVAIANSDICGNAAIMRLEKGHDLIKRITNKFQKPFYPTTTFQLKNDLDITILPHTFFDVLWTSNVSSNIQFRSFDDFFNIKELEMPDGLFGYHWHNRWKNKVPPFFSKI